MLQWLKDLFRDPTPQELLDGLDAFQMIYGFAFFPGKSCPFSKYVREKGAVTREFSGTRHDN